MKLNTYDLYWSPERRKIATVQAESSFKARRMAPKPYHHATGEVYAVRVWEDIKVTCTECGHVGNICADPATPTPSTSSTLTDLGSLDGD